MSELEKKYNNFIKETQLEGMRLTGSEFLKKSEFDQYEYDELRKSIFFEVEEIVSDEDSIYIHVCWTLTFKKGNKILVKIKVCYELAYNESEFFEDDIVPRFVKTVVKPTTYPYLRQMVNRISEDAFLGMPPLPMLKLMPTNSKAKELVED